LKFYAPNLREGKELLASFFIPIGQDLPPQEQIKAFYRSSAFEEGATYTFASANPSGIAIAVVPIRIFIDDLDE